MALHYQPIADYIYFYNKAMTDIATLRQTWKKREMSFRCGLQKWKRPNLTDMFCLSVVSDDRLPA